MEIEEQQKCDRPKCKGYLILKIALITKEEYWGCTKCIFSKSIKERR